MDQPTTGESLPSAADTHPLHAWGLSLDHPLTVLSIPAAGTLAAYAVQLGRARYFGVPQEFVRIDPEDVIRATAAVGGILVLQAAIQWPLDWLAKKLPIPMLRLDVWSYAPLLAFGVAIGAIYGFRESGILGFALLFSLIILLGYLPPLAFTWMKTKSVMASLREMEAVDIRLISRVRAMLSERWRLRIQRTLLAAALLYLCVITGRIDAHKQDRFLSPIGTNQVAVLISRDHVVLAHLRPGTRILSGRFSVVQVPGAPEDLGYEYWPGGRVQPLSSVAQFSPLAPESSANHSEWGKRRSNNLHN